MKFTPKGFVGVIVLFQSLILKTSKNHFFLPKIYYILVKCSPADTAINGFI